MNSVGLAFTRQLSGGSYLFKLYKVVLIFPAVVVVLLALVSAGCWLYHAKAPCGLVVQIVSPADGAVP